MESPSPQSGVCRRPLRKPAWGSCPERWSTPSKEAPVHHSSKELPAQRGLFALHLPAGTTAVVHGRQLEVAGDQAVSIWLVEGGGRPERTTEIKPGTTSDLTMWRRAAQGRAGQPWPAARLPAAPEGAERKAGDRRRRRDAGGRDEEVHRVGWRTGRPDRRAADSESRPGAGQRRGQFLYPRPGARNVKVLPARTVAEVEDPKNLAILKEAKGVWFGGGRQWRFVDAYEGTKAEEAFRDVLRRGGVIGGSSAGATIQGDYLCRGSPLNNTDVQCEGYERGLGFLPGVAVDQHFTQRKRHPDMTALMKQYPQFLGIGLDEATAIIVKGSVAEVKGRGKAHFYDTKRKTAPGEPDYEALSDGGRYDLKARKVVAEKKE